ncbi:hypothetical protein HTV80_29375 [Streptomyces sp. Vc74B-19]|uniref:hypothetical protein n=1 Tax=unclassified Streptomyces TaxID=2593676 RepID=UPI001BFC3172|nr:MULTISPECIES: hypothetical protein [unclassified Streptomyces]MBT3167174.1 hypothetical protein [Streptomyces sp. Vc74B-19]MCO4697149.1 hypothetical protein [Streptomyces sp. RO-S4]MDU0304882.1 hypothetical protein [Streptomyces sp. PAL114]
MYEPNVVGDWQEYDEHAGLRVRVHRLEAGEPPRGRDEAAEGLSYFRVRVTVENRGDRPVCIHLEDGQIDVRTGPDGESAFIDWRNSQFIEGFDVYPLRRATAVLYAAGPEGSLAQVDVQVQLRADEEWAGRRLWTGGIGTHEPAPGTPAGAARETLAQQVSLFLQEQAEEGTA